MKLLADCEWTEEPALTLHEWRVRLGAARGAAKLQVEFLRMGDEASMILSPVDGAGSRGAEIVIGKEALRTLRALLRASDLK